MTRCERIEDLPQVEGCKTPKARRPKQGHKEPQKQSEKERKVKKERKKENKKPERKPILTPSGANISSAKGGVGTNGSGKEEEGR
jgi:hypothetical protein